MFNIYKKYFIDKNIAQTKNHRSTRQTLWKKTPLSRLSTSFKFNDSLYVCLCKTFGHTYVKPFNYITNMKLFFYNCFFIVYLF